MFVGGTNTIRSSATLVQTFVPLNPLTSTGTTGQLAIDGSQGTNISINNNATATPVNATYLGGALVFVADASTNNSALFYVWNNGNSVTKLAGDTIFTVTINTASSWNVYLPTSGTLTIQNKTGSNGSVKVMIFSIVL